MSGQIEFDGDDLARRVPLLAEFRDDLEQTVDPLADITACRWADGVPDDDKLSLQARDAIRTMLTKYVLPAYVALGDSVGLQGDKLDLIRTLGDTTENHNGEIADGWSGGGHHG